MTTANLWILAAVLYAAGFGLAYAMAPLSFPVSMAGRKSWKRWTVAGLWPIAGLALLCACFATNWA